MENGTHGAVRLLHRQEVAQLCGVSTKTIREWVRAGLFPAPITLGTRSIRWRADELSAWIAERSAAREKTREARGVSGPAEATA